MLRIFKGTSPGVIALMALTLAVFWTGAFIHPQSPSSGSQDAGPMPLYGVMVYLIGNIPAAGTIFSFIICILVLFLLVNFNTSQFFIHERTFLPATLYILFSGLLPQCRGLNPALPAVVFLMLAIRRIMDSYRKPGIAYNFFDAGVLIGIGTLFYANLVWFGILAIVGIVIIRTGNLKEIVVSVMGLITPLIITTGLYYVLGRDLTSLFHDIKQNLFGEAEGYLFSRLSVTAIIFSGLTLIVSVAFLARGINSKKIKARKTFSILLWAFFVSLVLYFALPSVSVEMIWITAMPASYLLAHYFIFARRKIFPEIIFTGFLLLILLIQVIDIF
jgi:hypothetical protein